MAINYSQVLGLDRQVPAGVQFQQGLSFGQGIRDRIVAEETARQQLQAQRQVQMRVQRELNELANMESPSPKDFARFALRNPEFSKAIDKPLEIYKGERKDKEIQYHSGLFSLLKSGRIDSAKKMLERREIAARNAGEIDDAEATKTVLEIAEKDPKSALLAVGLTLTKLSGGDFTDTVVKTDQAQRAQELHGPALKEAVAKAGVAKVDAKYAEQNAKLDLRKKRAGIGKMSAETKLTLAKIKQLNAQDAPGKFTKMKDLKLKAESSLQKDYRKNLDAYFKVERQYENFQAATDDAAGDTNRIISFRTMLEPGSIVREGEFAMSAGVGGLMDKLWNMTKHVKEGDILSPEARKKISAQVNKLMVAARKFKTREDARVKHIVKANGLDPRSVLVGDVSDETIESLADKYL